MVKITAISPIQIRKTDGTLIGSIIPKELKILDSDGGVHTHIKTVQQTEK